MNALRTNNPLKTTGYQQAGFLESEMNMMMERLRQKEDQVRNSPLGQAYLDKHPIISQDVKDHIEQIKANIAKLRNETPANAASTPSRGTDQQALDWLIQSRHPQSGQDQAAPWC